MSFHRAASSAVWILGRYSTSEEPESRSPPVIVGDVEHHINDGRGKAGAADGPDVTVVQMQPARAKDLGREVELLFQSLMMGRPEKTLRPLVHLARHLFGNLREQGIALDGQLEVALVVQRHGRELAQRVLAIEHPTVGARQ